MTLADAGVNCFSMYDSRAKQAAELPEGSAALSDCNMSWHLPHNACVHACMLYAWVILSHRCSCFLTECLVFIVDCILSVRRGCLDASAACCLLEEGLGFSIIGFQLSSQGCS